MKNKKLNKKNGVSLLPRHTQLIRKLEIRYFVIHEKSCRSAYVKSIFFRVGFIDLKSISNPTYNVRTAHKVSNSSQELMPHNMAVSWFGDSRTKSFINILIQMRNRRESYA